MIKSSPFNITRPAGNLPVAKPAVKNWGVFGSNDDTSSLNLLYTPAPTIADSPVAKKIAILKLALANDQVGLLGDENTRATQYLIKDELRVNVCHDINTNCQWVETYIRNGSWSLVETGNHPSFALLRAYLNQRWEALADKRSKD